MSSIVRSHHELEIENQFLRKKLKELEENFRSNNIQNELQKIINESIKTESVLRKQQKETELSNERLESLLRISQFPNNNIQELLDFALDEAINLTNSKIGYIYFYSEEQKQFTLNTWSKGVMDECRVMDPQTVYDLDKTGIWGEAVRQRRPILVNDFPAHNPLKKGVPEGHVALMKFLTIPVIFENRIVAVVGVANKETNYDNSDIRQLTLLMDNVWKISERVRLIDELRKAKEKAEENELLLNLLLEHSPILMFIKDENIKAKRLSRNFESLVGVPLEQMLGKSNYDLFPNEFGKKLDDDDLKVFKENKTTVIEEEFSGRYYTTIKFPVKIEGRASYLAGFSVENTEQKLAEQALKESEERWKFAVEGARDGLWDWNLETNEVFFSSQWKKMLGFNDDEISNTVEEWSKRVHPDDLGTCYSDIQLHLDGKTDHYSNVHRLLCKNGSYKWILDRGKIIKYNKAGNPLRMIGTHTDLTERINIEETIKQQNTELTKLNADKDRFISVLAHDLKNPFSTILGFLDLLNHNLYKYNIDQIAAQLNIIDTMAQKTYDLLIDLLQWAKSQSNQLKLEPEKILVSDLCANVIDSLESQAKNKKIIIQNNIKDELIIYADPVLLKGILRNLISNAIKFSFENSIVQLDYKKDETQIIFIVSDNGVGIPEANISKLWDKSQPYSTPGTAKEIGTGLGLLLCQEFVELHEGRIWVESEVGVGSKFKFSFPLMGK